MDESMLTHVAAVVVGVVITLLLVHSLNSSKTKEAPVSTSSSAASSSSSSKKKKKKKNKSAGANVTANEEKKEEEPLAATSNNNKSKKNKKKKVTIPEEPTTDVIDETGASAVNDDNNNSSSNNNTAAAATTSSKKKKKKKGGGGAATATANGIANTITSNTSTSTNGNQENDAFRAQAPAPAPKQDEDDEWATIPSSKKKKKRAPKPKVAEINAATAPPTVPTSTDSISVDAKKIGIIIGPKGATMQALQEATGCQLDINAPSKEDLEANHKKGKTATAGVVISGPDKDSINKAKKAIQELATKGYATCLQGDNFGEYSIQVHPKYLSEIVGGGGKTIQAIQNGCQVKLTIPSTDWKPNMPQTGQKVPFCQVGIAGSKDNAKQAKEVIKAIMKYHHHEVTHPGMTHEEVHVPQEFFHCVIGPRGSEIKHIRGNYKVEVYMPASDSYNDTPNVLVVGKQTNVDKAISYIQLLMDRDAEQRDKKYQDEYY